MSIIIPIGASVFQATSMTIDKFAMKVKNVSYKTYTGVSFPLIFLFTLMIFLIFRPEVSSVMFGIKNMVMFVLLIILVLISNLLYFRALKNDELTEMQSLSLLKNIPLIIFSAIIFIDERNMVIIALSVIAIFAVIWSHFEKSHFKVSKKTLPYLIWTATISPFAGILYKVLLETWSPISLQLVSDGIIALILVPAFFDSVRHVPKKALPLLIATNLFTSIAWIMYFFSYQIYGIIYTVLIFSLQPVLVYFASLILLKEKFHKRKFIAFLVIIAVIVLAQVIK